MQTTDVTVEVTADLASAPVGGLYVKTQERQERHQFACHSYNEERRLVLPNRLDFTVPQQAVVRALPLEECSDVIPKIHTCITSAQVMLLYSCLCAGNDPCRV